MLTKQAKTKLREELFRHLDGIAVAPVAHQFFKRNISEYILSTKQHKLSEVSKFFNANEGYLNVALRVLASQGWVEYTINNSTNEVILRLNDRSEIAFSLFKYYGFAVEFLELSRNFHPKESNPADFYKIQKLLEEFQSISFSSSESSLQSEIQHQVFKHLEGALVGPLTVALAMNGFFHKYFMEASFRAEEYHEEPESFRKILDFYTFLNWFEKKENTYTFTEKGLFFAKRASAYGVTVSYIPTFNNIEDVLFGNYATIRENPKNKTEIHVDRVMNVWGSGGAHTAYFREIDDIIIEIFNKPIDEQPKGILDMGCGNGAFLIHLFDVIEQRTLRGTLLEDYPLFLVGVDFNKEALKVTRSNLVNADIWAKVIWGDIGDPNQLENSIYQDYSIHLGDLLNVRTFLDHNRIWTQPKDTNQTAIGNSTGAFAFRGKKLNNNLVALNLKEHFQKWEPYIKKHGLLLIELHTLSPSLASKNIGKTAVTAYDATHGFSDQYIVELDVFLNVLNEIGLKSKKKYFSKYPNTELATVSIHYIKE